MIVVIIAGGSGTRLWPLSTPTYPKHLLKINGEQKSLLQNTYDRALRLSHNIYVFTDASHSKHVQEQLPALPEDNLLIEPGRRGTANCVVAALAYLSGRHDADEPVVFMHADHYIRDVEGFAHSFKLAGEVSHEEHKIVLVGVEPDHPATGFGYIQKGGVFDKERYVYTVDSFKEKPDYATAKKFLKGGKYLWNCGYFVGSLQTFQNVMKQYAPDLLKNYEQLRAAKSPQSYQKIYQGFDSEAIDYALIEKVEGLLVVPASFDWMDVGSYHDMQKAVDQDEQGNHVYGKRVETDMVENSFIQNYEDKPLAVVGLNNVVVVNTKDGILVARKDLAKQIGDVSKRFHKK